MEREMSVGWASLFPSYKILRSKRKQVQWISFTIHEKEKEKEESIIIITSKVREYREGDHKSGDWSPHTPSRIWGEGRRQHNGNTAVSLSTPLYLSI